MPLPHDHGALFQVDQPWNSAVLAPLYDAFPFEEDVPLYIELAEREGGHVLEVACGSGRVLVPLAIAGTKVAGLDASPHMLALAQAKLSGAGPDVQARASLVEGDMRSFRLDRQFDMAFIAVKSFAYLKTRAEQQQTLANIAAHLRPGGLFVLDLMNPSPGWLMEAPGSVRQDLAHTLPDSGITVVRTEAVISTDLAAQIRRIRSAYEVVQPDGSLRKYFVEWPYRFTYRFEAELLLERAGFSVEALYGGYRCEPFTSESRTMVFVARLPG